MRTVIYLDVLLLVNFVVGAAFLLAAGLLCGACCSPLRLVGGAGAAAVSSLALLAPTVPWPLALTYKGTSAALCVAANRLLFENFFKICFVLRTTRKK